MFQGSPCVRDVFYNLYVMQIFSYWCLEISMGTNKDIMVLLCVTQGEGTNKRGMFGLFNKSLVCMKHVLTKARNKQIRNWQIKKYVIDSGH